jgi:predicted RND superfamily exporter protein
VLDRLIHLVRARPGHILVAALLLAIPMSYWSVALFKDVRANLKELLPQSAPSVVTLGKLEKRFGGYSQLSIILESPDRTANRRLSDDLVAELSKSPLIQSIRNKLGDEKQFFEKRVPFFIETADLEDIAERIEDAANDARARANPLLVDLEDKEPVSLDLSDIEKKYAGRSDLLGRFPNDYFELADGTRLAILVRRRGLAFSLSDNKAVLVIVEEALNRLQPAKYHPEMQVGLGGEVKNLVDEQAALVSDLAFATSVVFGLLALVIYLYYRRFRAIFMLAVPVFIGTVVTFGVGELTVGYLNISSAFLVSIIPGNGINFGIILLARYIEERDRGLDSNESISIAMRETLTGTATAAFACAVAYGSLIATDFLGFKHFGIIGGLGMVLCWFTTFTILPALIVFMERRWPMPPRKKSKTISGNVFTRVPMFFVTRAPRSFAFVGIASVIASVLAVALTMRDPFEKDFNKLRTTDTYAKGAAYWDKRKDEIFGRYLSPQVVLADRPEDVPAIVAHLEKQIKEGGETAPISDVTALTKLVPPDQDKKMEVLARIRTLLSPDLLANLEPEQRKKAERFRPPDDLKPFTAEDLPETIKADFRELDGRLGLAVLALPNIKLNLYHADNIAKVADVLRRIPLPDGRFVESSGNFVIYADMLAAVLHDGPRATLYSLIGVLLLCFLAFRRPARVALVISVLLAGVAWLGAAFVLLDLRINFLNFIALPITFGIGVDYAVNVYSRYLFERETSDRLKSITEAVVSTGGAVMLCSLTTVIGYASLLIARNGALVSFGKVAISGELATLTVALLVMPAWILIFSKE